MLGQYGMLWSLCNIVEFAIIATAGIVNIADVNIVTVDRENFGIKKTP